MSRCFHIFALAILACFFPFGYSAKILGICPMPSISHQVVFRGLTLELNKRGHELVVVTTDPVNDPTLRNYTEIDLNHVYKSRSVCNMIYNRDALADWLTYMYKLEERFHTITELILSHPELVKLYAPDSTEKFDLILLEMFYWPALMPLANPFNAPVVGVTSLGLPINVQYGIGNPVLTSHPSIWEVSTKDSGSSTTFWRRLVNFYRIWKFIHFYRTGYMEKQAKIARKYFGDDAPPLHKIEANDIRKILDEATQGFVYVSLGSNVQSKMLSNGTQAEFIAAFAELPYKVEWKFEADDLPGKPDNVLIIKWAPQQGILVFIYQGGLQSTEEAVSHGVPLIGLPVIADQDLQLQAEDAQLAVVDQRQTTGSDGKCDLVDGVRDSHSPMADEPWYIQQDMDIVAFISAGSLIGSGIALIILYQFLVYSLNRFTDVTTYEKPKQC